MLTVITCTAVLLVFNFIGMDAFLGNNVEESKWAHKIFRLIDKNADGNLTSMEVEAIYPRFDLNGNGAVDAGEFIKHWLVDDIGDTASGYRMFVKLDTDKDGNFSKEPDLTRMFKNFDIDGNGLVDEIEFALTWTKLSL